MPVRNTSGSAIALKGWVLKHASRHAYVFPNVKVGAGKYMKIHAGRGTDTASNKLQNRRWYVWDNTSDAATLTKASGTQGRLLLLDDADPSDTYC